MLKPIDQRLEALQKAGFKISKNRELKSGTQYKVLTPKAIRKLWPVVIVRGDLEDAVAFAEGVSRMWEVVQQKLGDRLSTIAGDFEIKQ